MTKISFYHSKSISDNGGLEEAGLEGSIISSKMRMRHLTSGTVLLWLLIVVNWWNMNSLEKLDLIPWYGLKWCG